MILFELEFGIHREPGALLEGLGVISRLKWHSLLMISLVIFLAAPMGMQPWPARSVVKAFHVVHMP
jgi:hypothetical protein